MSCLYHLDFDSPLHPLFNVKLLHSTLNKSVKANHHHRWLNTLSFTLTCIHVTLHTSIVPKRLVWQGAQKTRITIYVIQFEILFTLCLEYFSSFPHSTCLLSISHEYLVLEEIYLPYSNCNTKQLYSQCIPLIKSRLITRLSLSMVFEKQCLPTRDSSFLTLVISTLITHNDCSSGWTTFPFTRRYFENPFLFLFHYLLICLSSVGTLAWSRPVRDMHVMTD